MLRSDLFHTPAISCLGQRDSCEKGVPNVLRRPPQTTFKTAPEDLSAAQGGDTDRFRPLFLQANPLISTSCFWYLDSPIAVKTANTALQTNAIRHEEHVLACLLQVLFVVGPVEAPPLVFEDIATDRVHEESLDDSEHARTVESCSEWCPEAVEDERTPKLP